MSASSNVRDSVRSLNLFNVWSCEDTATDARKVLAPQLKQLTREVRGKSDTFCRCPEVDAPSLEKLKIKLGALTRVVLDHSPLGVIVNPRHLSLDSPTLNTLHTFTLSARHSLKTLEIGFGEHWTSPIDDFLVGLAVVFVGVEYQLESLTITHGRYIAPPILALSWRPSLPP